MSTPRSSFKPSEQLLVSWNRNFGVKLAGRAPSNIGKQGDHVSAYHLIELLAISIATESGLNVAITRFYHYFNNLREKLLLELDKVSSDIKTANQANNQNDLVILERRLVELKSVSKEIKMILDTKINQKEKKQYCLVFYSIRSQMSSEIIMLSKLSKP